MSMCLCVCYLRHSKAVSFISVLLPTYIYNAQAAAAAVTIHSSVSLMLRLGLLSSPGFHFSLLDIEVFLIALRYFLARSLWCSEIENVIGMI